MKNVVVVDFDECLCSVNSFRYWLAFSLIHLLVRLRPVAFAGVVVACSGRLLGMMDRVGMKKRVLQYTQASPEWVVRLFCGFLARRTNGRVVEKISEYSRQGMDVVLNTAAPAFYVQEYAKRFEFAHVIASPTVTSEDWVENLGPEKLVNLNAIYGGQIYNLASVISDHVDDLPLMKHAESVFLVCPDQNTLIGLTQNKIDFQLL